jgi:hypothetical protein
MTDRIALLGAATVVALVLLFMFRWQIVPAGYGGYVARLDRWTGRIVACAPGDINLGAPVSYSCHAK